MKITDLYANDLAVEVKNFYIEKLQLGYDDVEAIRLTFEQYSECFNSSNEDVTDYWLVMGDTQWNLGRLDALIKKRVIEIIDSNEDLVHYTNDQDLYEERKKVLENLLQKLKSPQPERKKIQKVELYVCPWKNNDVYAFQLKGKDASSAGIENRWLIIIKINEKYIKPGHVMPIVRFKLTKSDRLPATLREIDDFPYFMIYNFKGLIIYKSLMWIEKTRNMSRILKRLIYLGNYDFVEPYEPPTTSKSLLVLDLLEFEISKRFTWYYNTDSI
ncbi:MAG: hypothetical protein WC152_08410 [Candidatus Izemoplasmatales bacterium]